MRQDYRNWLKHQGYDEGTIGAQIYRVTRVEEFHGSLDAHYANDKLASLIELLSYSTEDQRNGRPNPSNIPFVGNARNNLASYKSCVLWYRRFLEGGKAQNSSHIDHSEGTPPHVAPAKKIVAKQHGAKTLVDFGLDGRMALDSIIASSQYQTIAQAVASLTLFSHPETVKQTAGKALFPAIRNPKRVGQIDDHEGSKVLLDDNRTPTNAFLWANGLTRRGTDTQFNHVYAASLDVNAYTALPNICMTPAFIAKLTDTSTEIRSLLQYRSYALYGWVPSGFQPPERPQHYDILEWAAPLPVVADVRGTMLRAMKTKPKDRTVLAVQEIGWLFA
jgi:hypothetical protein